MPKPSPLKRLFGLLATQRQEVYNIYLYALLNGALNLSIPLGISAIINLLQAGSYSTSWIILVALVLLGLSLAGIFQILQLTSSERIQQRIFANASIEFAFRLPHLRLSELKANYPPELVNRFFDVMTVQKGLSKILFDFSLAGLQILFGFLLLAFYHPFFIAFGLIALFILVIYLSLTARNGLSTSLVESKKKYKLVSWLEEVARNLKSFKMVGKSSLPTDRADEHTYGYLKSRKSHFNILRRQYIFLTIFKVLIAGSLLILGGILVFQREMNIGQFVAAEIIILLVTSSVEKLIYSMETIYDVLTGLEKVGSITDLGVEGKLSGKAKTGSKGFTLKIRQLSLRSSYSSKQILDHIDLDLLPGEKIALWGPPGSGKTALLELLAGLYDHYEGSFLINNFPARNIDLDEYRSRVGDNMLEEEMFEGSLRENITLGSHEIKEAEWQELLDECGLRQMVEELPAGLDTPMPSSGIGLSKVMRQRIVMARCLVSKADLWLIEDNFYEPDAELRRGWLDHFLNSPASLVMVSNDPALLQRVDRVIMLEHGRIVANAPYSTLKSDR